MAGSSAALIRAANGAAGKTGATPEREPAGPASATPDGGAAGDAEEAVGAGGGASADVPDSHVDIECDAPCSRTPVVSGSATIKPMVAMASA